MIGFSVIAFVMTMAVLVVVLLPLWVPCDPVMPVGEKGTQALRILREQRADLDAALATGQIDDATHAESINELVRRVAEETVPVTVRDNVASHRRLALAAGFAVVLVAGLLYWVMGNPLALDAAARQTAMPISAVQIAAMVDKLAIRVAANPADTEAAQMLGRSYMLLGRYADAVATYARLARQQPANPEVLTDWANALANANGGKVAGEPERIAGQALQLAPENPKALALAGTAAFEQERYAAAIAAWQKMAAHVDPQSEMGQAAEAMIGEARARLDMLKTSDVPRLSVTGRVSLDPALMGKVAASDTVFVFARNPEGGPPFAVLRYAVADLPLDFDFAKAASMGFPGVLPAKIVIVARISKTGTASPAADDVQTASGSVAPDAKGVQLTLGKSATR